MQSFQGRFWQSLDARSDRIHLNQAQEGKLAIYFNLNSTMVASIDSAGSISTGTRDSQEGQVC